MILTCIALALAFVCVLWYVRLQRARPLPRPPMSSSPEASLEQTLDTERSYINFSYAAGSATKTKDRLLLRAIPNLRLRNAFGVDNSFTTMDLNQHRRFLRVASGAVKVSSEDWQSLFNSAMIFINRMADKGMTEYPGYFSLAPFCRSLCLRQILSLLFKIEPSSVEEADIHIITEQINRQWLASKSPADISQSSELNDVLSRVMKLSTPNRSPQEALGLILPSYETLWRVVLLTFVTAFHKTPIPVDPSTLGLPACLATTDSDSHAQLRRLAKEGLRLFPSTKRVYRAVHLESSSRPSLKANVERWHRHPAIWGDDAIDFRPERFTQLTPLQKKAYMPFGLRPNLCPAYSDFGEMIVGILVVALGSRLGQDLVVLRFNNKLLDSNRMAELPTGRNDMEDWTVERA